MKRRLPVSLSMLIAFVLVAFGILYGTASGYREDREDVMELFAAENGLLDVLHYRAADGLNLCVVAGRHLNAEDEGLRALEQTARKLQNAVQPEDCFRHDGEMDALIQTVQSAVLETSSLQASERDQRYLDMLRADLNNLSSSAAVTGYNEAAEGFNRQLQTPLLGRLAQLLGLRALPLYGLK